VVFGTDCPLQGSLQMRFAIEAVKSLDIPQEDKELILCRNAVRILGL